MLALAQQLVLNGFRLLLIPNSLYYPSPHSLGALNCLWSIVRMMQNVQNSVGAYLSAKQVKRALRVAYQKRRRAAVLDCMHKDLKSVETDWLLTP